MGYFKEFYYFIKDIRYSPGHLVVSVCHQLEMSSAMYYLRLHSYLKANIYNWLPTLQDFY